MKSALRRWLLKGLAQFGGDSRGGLLSLTYHSLEESGSPISFPVCSFRAQIAWLASQGYQALTARQAAALLRQEEVPPRSVVITFDDGFRSVSEAAFPILSEYGFPAVVFCAAGYVGKTCGWERAAGIPAWEMMGWEDLAVLAAQGWEIGGHTVSHAHLTRLPPAAARQEIEEGRDMLEQGLGKEVVSFAYPYGECNRECAVLAAQAGFVSAWTMTPTINYHGGDPFTLGRFNCDRIRSNSPETAALAAQVYAAGRYRYYAWLTARSLRLRRKRRA